MLSEEQCSVPDLTLSDQALLLNIARGSIISATGGSVSLTAAPEAYSQALTAPCGAFVTLRKRGMLRGCMGLMSGEMPMTDAVARAAQFAAERDPRFPALRLDELNDCSLEISIISRHIPCSAEQIVPGRDGVVLKYKGIQGLLLPQVAVEHGWTREQFLEAVSQKSGLDSDIWRHPSVQLYRFTAVYFSANLIS